jgi:hypothetical protein
MDVAETSDAADIPILEKNGQPPLMGSKILLSCLLLVQPTLTRWVHLK